MSSSYKIKNLALSGGGFKGFTFFGAYKALYDMGICDEIERYAGTSAGAAVLYAIVLKFTPDEMLEITKGLEYRKLQDFAFLNVINSWGVETGNRIEIFTKALMKKKLGNPDATFLDLYNYNPVEFTVVATHLNKYKAIYYNYKNTPNESVSKAIRKSVSVPIAIVPVKEDDKDVYVDGGIIDNFPIQLFPDKPETVGIVVECCKHIFRPIESAEAYMASVIACMSTAATQTKLKKIKKARIIHIDVSAQTSLNIYIKEEERLQLYQLGYNQAKETMEKYFEELDNKKTTKNK